jgi:dihydropteroate synthase
LIIDDMLQAVDRVRIMGILNVTPDSFSDGGRFVTPESVLAQATAMVDAGADIIDVGGESTRPFAEPVSIAEELRRVIDAIIAIRKHHTIPISIDTTKAVVAREALAAGADIINDISALRFDPEMIGVVRATDVPVIIMHMKGTPRNMQRNPVYEDVVTEIIAFLDERLRWAEEMGVERKRFIIDPGIGFGKTVTHNLLIIKRLQEFTSLGCPLLLGHSRKSFIGTVLGQEVDDREIGTAAVSVLGALNGAAILRVHDVATTVQAVRMAEAVMAADVSN